MAAVGTQTRTKDVGPFSTTYILDVTTSADTGASSGWDMAYRDGYLQEVKIRPDSGGTAPTTGYDVTLVDAETLDVLASRGGDLVTATGTYNLIVDPGTKVRTKLDLQVANGGNSKGITVYITVGDQR